MVKTLSRLIIFVLLAGVAFLGYRHFVPNEETRIRETLSGLAKSVSIPEKTSPVTTMMAVDRIRGYLMPDVEVSVELLADGKYAFTGREELMEAVKASWFRARSVKVEFLDIGIRLDGPDTATSELTVRATKPGESDFIVQEFSFRLKKHDGDWRIAKAESVKALK